MSEYPHTGINKKDINKNKMPIYAPLNSNYFEESRAKFNYPGLPHAADHAQMSHYPTPAQIHQMDLNFQRNYLHRPPHIPNPGGLATGLSRDAAQAVPGLKAHRPPPTKRQQVRTPPHNINFYNHNLSHNYNINPNLTHNSPHNIPHTASPHNIPPHNIPPPPHNFPPYSHHFQHAQPHKYFPPIPTTQNNLQNPAPYPSYALSSQNQPPKSRPLHPPLNQLPITRPDFETFHRILSEKHGIPPYNSAELDSNRNYRFGFSAHAYDRNAPHGLPHNIPHGIPPGLSHGSPQGPPQNIPHGGSHSGPHSMPHGSHHNIPHKPHHPAHHGYQPPSDYRPLYYPPNMNHPSHSHSTDTHPNSPPRISVHNPPRSEREKSPHIPPKTIHQPTNNIPDNSYNQDLSDSKPQLQPINEAQNKFKQNGQTEPENNNENKESTFDIINELKKISIPSDIKYSGFDNTIKIKHNKMSIEDAKFRMKRFYQGFEEYIEYNKEISKNHMDILRELEKRVSREDSKENCIPVKLDLFEDKLNDIQIKLSRMQRVIVDIFNPYETD